MEEKKTRTINILGETERGQWHTVVRVLRINGQDMTYKAFCDICDEIDRFIDYAEDVLDELRAEEQEENA